MTATLHWLHIGAPAPAVAAATGFGPFVVHEAACGGPREWEACLPSGVRADAVVCVGAAAQDALVGEGQHEIAQLARRAAVVLVADAVDPPAWLRALRAGVQAVLSTQEAAQPAVLASAVHQAVERHRRWREASRAFATDLATGLPNQAQLMEHLSHLVALREREPATMAVMALQVSGVEAVVQQLGAEAGNVLRRKVAVRLRACLRASDVAAAASPDRFSVLLARMDDASSVQAVASKVADSLQRAFQVTGREWRLGCRLGWALFPGDARDPDALLRAAQAALDGQMALGQAAAAQLTSLSRAGAADPARPGRAAEAANDAV